MSWHININEEIILYYSVHSHDGKQEQNLDDSEQEQLQLTLTLTLGMYLENRSYSLLIWKASSRV